jgi:hypothetical protein
LEPLEDAAGQGGMAERGQHACGCDKGRRGGQR